MTSRDKLESKKENLPPNGPTEQHDQTCNASTDDSKCLPFTASWSTHVLDVGVPSFRKSLEPTNGSLSHGYIMCYSPNGQILAIALNHSNAANSRMIFLSQLEKTSVTVPLYEQSMCPEESGVYWWVNDMQWSSDCLFLACVTRRGALAVLTRFGEPIFLKTEDAGPSKYLPLHPLVIVSTSSNQRGKASSPMRQEFSVAFHRTLKRLLISDGYGITILQLRSSMHCCTVVKMLCAEASHCIQQTETDGTLHSDSQHDLISQSPDGSQVVATPDNPPPDEQFTSTGEVTATSSSFVQSDLSISQGVIQFAGIDLDESRLPSQSGNKEDFTAKLMSLLLSAWALILTEGKWRVDRGEERPVIQQGLLTDDVCDKLLDMFAVTWGLYNDSNKQLAVPYCESESLFKSLLSLVRLDSVRQHRLDLVLKMVRIYIASRLSQPYQHENLSHLHNRIRLMMSTRELLKLTDTILTDSYSWKPICSMEGENPHDYSSSMLTLRDEFIPYVIQSEGGNRSSACVNDTKLPSCWLSIYQEAKSLSLQLSRKFSSDADTAANSTESTVNLNTVLNSSLQFYATISGDIQCLGLSSDAELKSDSDEFFKEQLKKQIEAMKRNSVVKSHEVFPLVSGERARHYGIQCLSQLILNFQQYDVRSAFLLVNSHLQVNGSYLDLSMSGDLSHLDELHRLRYFAQAHAGSIRPRKMKPADMLSLLPVMTVDVKEENATVTCLAQLMAAYFTNLPLLVAPPHHPCPSPLLHDLIRDSPSCDEVTARFSELSRDLLLEAIKDQSVTDCWTVHLTAELLLACCLANDIVWFVYKLGDWRTAFSLSTIFSRHNHLCKISDCSIDLDPYTLIREPLERHTHIKELNEVIDLFLIECQSYQVQVNEERMGRPHIEKIRELIINTDPNDFSPNYRKIENILHAAAVAGLDIITSMANQLLLCLKRLIWSTAWVVPVNFDLPAPPPYCLQTWQIQGEEHDQVVIETAFRLLVHIVVMSLVSLLKGSRCLHSCVLTYIGKLREQPQGQSQVKVLKKSYTLVEESMVLDMNPVVVTFREFCGLLWLFHVRDEIGKLLKQFKPTSPPVEVSDCLKWFASALQFQQSFTVPGVLKKMMLTLLLQVGVNNSVAAFIGSYFVSEIEIQKESIYKEELKHILDLIQNQAKDDVSESGLSMSDLCKQASLSRALFLHSLAQQYMTVNTFITDLTLLSGEVGSWECESKVFFAKFLDRCFEIMVSHDSSQKQHDSQLRSPFLPSLHQLSETPPDDGTPGAWPQLVPLIVWLQKWSSRGVKHPTGSSMDSRLERSHSSNSSIKVCLTVDSIISCLLLREQELREIGGKNSTLPLMFLRDYSHDFVETKADTRDPSIVVKSEGEVTIPSLVESLSGVNISSLGEIYSKGSSKGCDTGSDNSILVIEDESEHHCEETELQLLRLDVSDLTEIDSDEVTSLAMANLLCSTVVQLEQTEGLDISNHVSVESQESNVLTTNAKPQVDIKQEQSYLPSAAIEIVSPMSDTSDNEVDLIRRESQTADHDVNENSRRSSPIDDGTISTELVQDNEDDYSIHTDAKEQTISSNRDVEVKSPLTCSSVDQYDDKIEPVIKATHMVTESRREPFVPEENRRMSEANAIHFGGNVPSAVGSGVVEAAIVQQSLAQHPFSRSDLHRILQAQRSYIEQIMTVVESSDVATPVLDKEKEPKSRETTVEQPHVKPKSDKDQYSGPHQFDCEEMLRNSTPGLANSNENYRNYKSQTQSPLLRIDDSLLSKTPEVPLVSQPPPYKVPSEVELKPSLPLLSLPGSDSDTEGGLLDNTMSSLPKPVLDLKLLRLPDQQNELNGAAQLSGAQKELPVNVHSPGIEVKFIKRSSVSLPLLHLPNQSTEIPVEKPIVATNLPLLHIDHNHPILTDPSTMHMPTIELKESSSTPLLSRGRRNPVVRMRRKRRQAEGIGQKTVVAKATETQVHHITSDSDEKSVQKEASQEPPLSPNTGFPKPNEKHERPVSEWSPAVAVFHKQIESTEADLAQRESEGIVVRRPGRSYVLPVYHKGLTAAEIEMLPIESIVNRVSSAVQTDLADVPEKKNIDRSTESRAVAITVQDAATQSEHFIRKRETVHFQDLQENPWENEEEPVGDAVDSKELETEPPLPQELPQVLAPHLFFGLQFPQGDGSDNHGFISVVDIPASSLNDVPEVSAGVEKEGLKPIVEEESVIDVEGHHTVVEKALPVKDVSNELVSPEELVPGATDALTTHTSSDHKADIQISASEVQALPIKDSRLKSQFLAMMEQLDAIEETAKHVQEEFKDSKLLLHTIDQLQAVEEARQPVIDIHQLSSHPPAEVENISDDSVISQVSKKSPDSTDLRNSRESLKEQLDLQDRVFSQIEGDQIHLDGHTGNGGFQSPAQHSLKEASDQESQIDINKGQMDVSGRESKAVSPTDEMLLDSGSVEQNVKTAVEENEASDYQTEVLKSQTHLASQSTWTVAKAPIYHIHPGVRSKPRSSYIQDRVSIQRKVGSRQQLSKRGQLSMRPQGYYRSPKW
jgi:hypothetical protein